jgi:hypothetical protein
MPGSARRKTRWIITLTIGIIVGIFIVREVRYNARFTAAYNKPADRLEAWTQDLEHFQHNYYEVSKNFPQDSVAAANKIIDSVKRNIPNFSDARIQLLLSRCVSMADDSHTRVFFGNFRRIPLRLYLFDDGLYVIKAQPGYEKLLGLKVARIGGKSVDELVSKVDQYMPGNKSWIEYKSSFFLGSPDFLEASGVIPSSDSVSYQFTSGADTITQYFSPQQMSDKTNEYTSWRDLYPLSHALSDASWKHVLQGKPLPLYLANPDTTATRHYIDSISTLYLQINACANIDRLEDYATRIMDSITVQNIVIDLRFNDGGDYTQLIGFTSSLPEKFTGHGHVYLITGKATFSAGICTLARLKYFSGAKAVIAGQAAGDGLQFWAEGKQFRLPNSGIRIRAVNGHHDWENNNHIPFKTFWLNLFLGVAAENITPNVPVPQTFKDYTSNRDAVLETILR